MTEQDPKAKLKAQVENALKLISATDDAKSLKAFHANILRHKELDDLDRERLNESTVQRLRVVAPAMAKRLGGPKDAKAREYLAKVWEQGASRYDLSKNKVGHGVRTGGQMISGNQFIDVYVSYKTPDCGI